MSGEGGKRSLFYGEWRVTLYILVYYVIDKLSFISQIFPNITVNYHITWNDLGTFQFFFFLNKPSITDFRYLVEPATFMEGNSRELVLFLTVLMLNCK